MSWRPWVLCLAPALLFVSCAEGGGDTDLLDRIRETEQRVLPGLEEWGGQRVPNEAMENDISRLLRDYASYANAHHGDSTANRMLVKRAELLLGRGDARAAEAQWLDIVEGGADAELMSEALFRIGFIRETVLADTTGAMKAYAEVMRLHPATAWSDMATDASKWLTFSEEQFIRALEQRQEDSRP